MKPIYRQYNHGGWHPFKKKEEAKTILKMSDRGEQYGTVAQQLGDAVSYRGSKTPTEDILRMMSLNAQEKPFVPIAQGVDFSLPGEKNSEQSVILPQFRASMDENTQNKNPINFFKLDPETQKYVRAKMGDADLSRMFGRELGVADEKFVRNAVLRDPTLLSYFMEIGAEPGRKEMKKLKLHSGKFGGGATDSGRTTDGAGSRSLAKAQNVTDGHGFGIGIGNKISNFIAWCKRDESCR
tara:strand:+ start:27 stop:743 length:717 start_codon:yes stop_codon:yes gene_type:complete